MYYLHLGKNESVNKKEIIGIFDMDNATMAKPTRGLLKQAQEERKIVSLSNDIPKSFVLCDNEYTETIYITGIPSVSLAKRCDD